MTTDVIKWMRTRNTTQTLNGRDERTGRFLTGTAAADQKAEQFIADLHQEWQKSGAKALKRVAKMIRCNL
jgi:hypothetical protein